MNDDAYRPLPILWAALVFGGHLLVPSVLAVTATGGEDPLVPGMLGLIGLLEAGMAVFGAPILFRKTPAAQAFLIRWAILTGTALFGGVAGFLGQPLVQLVLSLVGLAGMLATRPTPDRYTAWELRRLE